MDEFNMDGQEFKNVREYLGLSKKYVADLLKLTEKDIEEFEKGIKKPSEEQIRKLCEIYCMPEIEDFDKCKAEKKDSSFKNYYTNLSNNKKREILSLIAFRKTDKDK